MTRHVSNGTEDTPLPNNLSREQLYYQLYNIVFQDITNGVYEVGDLIPSETEYMQKFSVSRATVRKAMEMLVNNGLIVRRRGCGSEVVSAKPATALRSVESCIKRLTSDHVIPIKRVVSAEMTAAGKDVADALNVRTGSSVYRLERVRCAGETAYYRETIFLADDYAPAILEYDFSRESLRAYYSNVLHVSWARANQQVFAVPADGDTARLLGIEPGVPVLLLRRTSFDESGIPREYLVASYRTDHYYLDMTLEA